MSRETRPTKTGSLVDSGEEEIENDLVIWTPKEFQIKRVRENIVDSDRVSEGANIFTGKNIPDNALVISSHHLRFLRFPLHPLFQILWRVLGLHLMQLNPNSYMLLSGLLVMGKRWEASLGLGDFFYFHRLAHIAETTLYFNFTPRPLRKVFDERVSNFSNWNSEPLMVLGDWAAPEIPTSIAKAFSERAEYVPTSVDSLSSESRIKWLRDHVLSRGWNAAQFASKADLDDISHPRTGAIYSSRFQVLGDDLSGEALFRRVIELEKTAQADSEIVRVDSWGDKETGGPLQLDFPPSPCKSTSGPLAVSIPGANADIHPRSSSPSLKPRLCLSFRRDDGSYVSEGDPITFDKEACLAVAQSLALNTVDHDKLSHLSSRDLAAQLALCLQSASSMTQHIVMRTDATEERLWSIMHKAREEALTATNNLAKAFTALEQKSKEAEAKDKEIGKLKAKLINETAVRSKEFELNENEILKSSCKYFHLGWVQGQQNNEDRIFAGPESFDAEVGLDASDYDWILGMKLEDRPTDEEADDDVA